MCVVRYQHIHHIQNLRTTAVDCWSIWTSAVKHVLCVSASCRNTRCKPFTLLFYGTVNQLLINLVPFIVMIFLQKCHNYVIAQTIFNRFCQNQITISWYIHLQIFAESFIKFVQKLLEIYAKTNVSLFSEHGIYRRIYDYQCWIPRHFIHATAHDDGVGN